MLRCGVLEDFPPFWNIMQQRLVAVSQSGKMTHCCNFYIWFRF